MVEKQRIGILALQGAVKPHVEKLVQLGVEVVEVLTPYTLASVDALIVPGGESSAFLHLIEMNGLWDPLREFGREKPVWGICAGAILMASEVLHPAQRSLNLFDATVERNAYGRQLQSFVSALEPAPAWEEEGVEGVFIRAPRIKNVGPKVVPLLSYKGEMVMAREGKHLISTFHPELTESPAVHRYFLGLCGTT
ncbi:MAG: pyridoxal 5'-phosphate synthase glutaminase subunit PdxT [Bdellovibrionales bacterium]|nr:pyridoxal 5'-phosphate synthase glutaminase subunit PdxT [Bdellovibrionales bacterium]